MTLTVYTKTNCSFCDQTKSLLESRGVAYNTINLEQQPDARDFLVDQGLRSVPQIFNGTTLLQGGYQGLAAQPEEFWTQLKG
jgi:glutaredoxin-like protein NrdH